MTTEDRAELREVSTLLFDALQRYEGVLQRVRPRGGADPAPFIREAHRQTCLAAYESRVLPRPAAGGPP